MRIGALWTAALVGVAGLAAAIAVTAISSANGAPRGAVLDRPAPPRPAPDLELKLGSCRPGGGGGSSALRLGGSCPGLVTADFACVREGELAALSIRRPVGNGRVFYLTILIFEFEGPGAYFDDEASAQLIGPANVPRWTTLGSRIDIRLTPDGIYEIGDAVLLPEPGTPGTGVITIRGRVACA